MKIRSAIAWVAVTAVLFGCSLSPQQKEARAKTLKLAMDQFIGGVVAGNFASAYHQTTGFDNATAFTAHLKQPWDERTTLATGTVSSMAWAGDDAARVKVIWTFVSGAQQSHSAETMIWVWKGGKWLYKGRSLQ